jgi:hypothetical protein
VRGAARESLLARLRDIDAELIATACQQLNADALEDLAEEAESELAGFRTAMSEAAYGRARAAAIEQLVRARFHLPVVAF